MSELLRYKDQYYILAASPLADQQVRVLKHGDTFAVFDRVGDIQPVGKNNQGIFHDGMRHLSRFELRIAGQRPLLLSSTVKESNDTMVADLSNPEITGTDGVGIGQDVLHIFRSKFLWQGSAYETLTITNFGPEAALFPLSFMVEADFADVFEVRGITRDKRGVIFEPEFRETGLFLGYRGLDGITRKTRLRFNRAAAELSGTEIVFHFNIAPHSSEHLTSIITCGIDEIHPEVNDFETALAGLAGELERFSSSSSLITTTNQTFNHWIKRSQHDMNLLLTRDGDECYPYAGIPWYCTRFGRDGIITAMECLWYNPQVSRGVLSYLASTQARGINIGEDSEPGKIVHETRGGEMALTGEIPFRQYYGTVDATPLFVVLAGQYLERTGEEDFVRSLWPNIVACLEWIDKYGDCDGDGFVEYQRQSEAGLVNQGWKDSFDSVFTHDGVLAKGPIALCEVQGYVYEAKVFGSVMASRFGDEKLSAKLSHEAERLRREFDSRFWSEALGTYVLALDGEKRQCEVRSSNAGHCLFSGIVPKEKAQRIANTLLAPDMFSGWGIRTLSTLEKRYNPMAYHNGSVWPHDNAMIARGMARYGLKRESNRIFDGLFDACRFFEGYRIPELFCGFDRRADEGPTQYPVACSPQAWAVGSVFLLLQASLGLEMDYTRKMIRFCQPVLPRYLHHIKLKNLRLGSASVDLAFTAHDRTVGIDVVRKEGEVDIMVLK